MKTTAQNTVFALGALAPACILMCSLHHAGLLQRIPQDSSGPHKTAATFDVRTPDGCWCVALCVLLHAGLTRLLNASYNTSPEDSQDPFPVIVFSHGCVSSLLTCMTTRSYQCCSPVVQCACIRRTRRTTNPGLSYAGGPAVHVF
jgi:hypothetical protein